MRCGQPACGTDSPATRGCWPIDLKEKLELLDHGRELADQLRDLFELGIVVVIDAVRQPLDAFVVAVGRGDQMIRGYSLQTALHVRAPLPGQSRLERARFPRTLRFGHLVSA